MITHEVIEEDEAPGRVRRADVAPRPSYAVEGVATVLDSCRADERREQAEKPEDGDGDVSDSAGRRPHWDEHYESMDREREGAHPSEEVRELRCPAKKDKEGKKS